MLPDSGETSKLGRKRPINIRCGRDYHLLQAGEVLDATAGNGTSPCTTTEPKNSKIGELSKKRRDGSSCIFVKHVHHVKNDETGKVADSIRYSTGELIPVETEVQILERGEIEEAVWKCGTQAHGPGQVELLETGGVADTSQEFAAEDVAAQVQERQVRHCGAEALRNGAVKLGVIEREVLKVLSKCRRLTRLLMFVGNCPISELPASERASRPIMEPISGGMAMESWTVERSR
ncbi:uncharacterized protein LOC112348708 [Selaginella moellendorffii]|uniref:uncharacterized protein LOC112348708 n=1 Tax=Selaginella moellendorffii TaxID=88036 RepID=UPI000D1CE21E|nr:uncharacterized protein LOC112348708 [Selaginella moellendorffii]|eukprot:XP_024537518.1 uncharacterized protein LOC112348708 [Selaginella moellendorffii]